MRKYRRYTREILAPVVARSRTVREVMLFFGLKPNGGSQTFMRDRIVSMGLDMSHFLGKFANRGRRALNRRTAESILVELPPGSRKEDAHRLRRALVDSGIAEACAKCANTGQWNGQPLRLHVDHRNGNALDNRIGNLRFLCPNCHSQTENFGSKNIRQRGGTRQTHGFQTPAP